MEDNEAEKGKHVCKEAQETFKNWEMTGGTATVDDVRPQDNIKTDSGLPEKDVLIIKEGLSSKSVADNGAFSGKVKHFREECLHQGRYFDIKKSKQDHSASLMKDPSAEEAVIEVKNFQSTTGNFPDNDASLHPVQKRENLTSSENKDIKVRWCDDQSDSCTEHSSPISKSRILNDFQNTCSVASSELKWMRESPEKRLNISQPRDHVFCCDNKKTFVFDSKENKEMKTAFTDIHTTDHKCDISNQYSKIDNSCKFCIIKLEASKKNYNNDICNDSSYKNESTLFDRNTKRPESAASTSDKSQTSTIISDEFETKPKKKNECEVELDPAILSRRQKQIDYGKNTTGYQRYIEMVPKDRRTRQDPKTPPKSVKYSRRGWDGLIKSWRRKLHNYDPPRFDASDDEDSSQMSSSPIPTLSDDSEHFMTDSAPKKQQERDDMDIDGSAE